MILMETLIQNEYLQFILIIAGSIVFAKIFLFGLMKYIRKITKKTKTDLDDIILGIITKPLYVFIIFIGLYLALKSLSDLIPYFLWLDRLFFVAAVFILSMIFSRILAVFISRWLRVQKKFEKTPQLIAKISSALIYIIAGLVILDYFNIEITPLVAGFGLGGLAVGLALQSTLANFFAGLHIISDQPININDFIEIEGGISGYVEDIGWRSTRIRSLQNKYIIIPNSKLAESVIINESMPQPEMSAVVQCGVAYDSDLEKVERITIDVAQEIQKTVSGAVKNFSPFIRYHTFGDSNINFSVILRVEEPVARYSVIHEFIKALKTRYDREGIEISWPVRKIYQAK